MTACVIALLGTIAFMADGCAQRDQAFRVACVQNGGSVVASGAGPLCINGGKVTTR